MSEGRTPVGTQRGFTLVEVAMSMLVIASFLALIMTFAAMVRQANSMELKATLAGVEAATALYRDRYRSVPGDDPVAAARWLGNKNGNGDGLLGGRFDDPAPADPASLVVDAAAGETLAFWWHLRASGLIPGPAQGAGAASQPTVALGAFVGVQSTALGLTGPVACVAGMSREAALVLDTQLDDGRMESGSIRAAGGSLAAPDPGAEKFVVCRTLAAVANGAP